MKSLRLGKGDDIDSLAILPPAIQSRTSNIDIWQLYLRLLNTTLKLDVG